MRNHYKLIFLNQKVGYIFQELAEELSRKWAPSLLITQAAEYVKSTENLALVNAPCYNISNYFTRILSWIYYFLLALIRMAFTSRKSLIFIVSTPPFLGLVGYVFKKIKGQKYVMLVYDIHPDLLINIGSLKDGFIAKMWRKLNRAVWNNADAVITIGEYMAQNLAKQFDVSRTTLGKIAVIHNWADVEWMKPIPKDNNLFIKEWGLEGKFIVMYSGNIGATHDLETLVEAIKVLKDYDGIKFVVIGEGAKKQFVIDAKKEYGLDNLLILSYLPNSQLPLSLPAADVAIVSTGIGVDGFLVPSRFYFSIAAGNAVISICSPKCEIADIVREHNCGEVVNPGDSTKLQSIILNYYNDKSVLDEAKANSRRVAVEKYSSKNIQQYVNTLEKVFTRQ